MKELFKDAVAVACIVLVVVFLLYLYDAGALSSI